MKIITNKDQLEQLRQELGVRFDWHEPDERDVTAEFTQGEGSRGGLDNAMCSPDWEMGVYLLKDGERVAWVNLAMLFAFATGGYAGIGR